MGIKDPVEKLELNADSKARAQSKYINRMLALNKPPDESVELCEVLDFHKEMALLQWAGIGFSSTECYKIMCSLRQVADRTSEPKQKVRFWGKILGLQADYYVAEVCVDVAPEAEGDGIAPPEPFGRGANRYKYYVTNDLCNRWDALPDTKPEYIKGARKIKKMFTGKLNAQVVSHPSFQGREKVLLRAQIARINADTAICVKGSMSCDDDGTVVQDQEFVFPSFSQLLNKDAWIHREPHILRCGRTTHMEAPDENSEDVDQLEIRKLMLAEQEADPQRETLRSIVGDGLEWSVKKVCNSHCNEHNDAAQLTQTQNAVTFVRSLTWPGAVCVNCGSHTVNMYVGDGLKKNERDFFPPAPPHIQEEPRDFDEEPEPQGTLETEEEKKEEAG